jgi:DNA polymerase-3 subunit alpha
VQSEKNNNQMGLFADMEDGGISEPEIPEVPKWNQLVALKKEEEVTGIFISGHPLDDYRLELKYLCTADSDRVNQEDLQLGKPYRLAGMVREVRHLESKSGNGFGFIKVMDLKGGCEIPFFGEDYLKFRHLMVEDAFVYLDINLQKREFYDRKTQQKIKAGNRLHVTEMGLLTSLIDKSKGSVHLQCALDRVTEDWVAQISALFDAFPGDQVVKVDVYDRENNMAIPFYSQRKIKRNKAFLAALDKMEEVNFKIH